ncbi:MAG: hypothetical protein MUF24_08600 [Chitinophagaceae bacterium]|jgi:hypothetical protein|nr:hypothetical protein [Chitinophagaceae bacterium]
MHILLFSPILYSQADTGLRTINQCSQIRELIVSASAYQFSNITLEPRRKSHGYQSKDNWHFETTQYFTRLWWPGSTICYIDFSEEKSTTQLKQTWQYVAAIKNMASAGEAKLAYERLNKQIAACRLPLNDSNIAVLKPLDFEKIEAELPVAALDARLYPVRLMEPDTLQKGQEVVVMTAYEKAGKQYNAYMIIELRWLNAIAKPVAALADSAVSRLPNPK